MNDEWNLGDQGKPAIALFESPGIIYPESDVKKFLKRQREREITLFNNMPVNSCGTILWDRTRIADEIIKIREGLAGDKLIVRDMEDGEYESK